MNDIKINKNEKIHFLEFLKEATTLYDIVFLSIFAYIANKMEDIVPVIAFNIILFLLFFLISLLIFFYIKIIIKLKTSIWIKKEYIKINSEIKYLKYIPENEMDNIENYIKENKKELELKYEEELLKKQISNF